MNKTMLIARTEVRTSLGRKTFVLFAYGLPILIGIISLGFILIRGGQDDSGQEDIPAEIPGQGFVGYVDPAGIIQSIPENVPEDWLLSYPDPETARQALDDGDIEGYYQISQDYVTSGELSYVARTFNPRSPVRTEALEWILLFNLAGREEGLATSIWQPFDLTMTSLAPQSEEAAGESFIEEMLPTIMTLILYMVIIMTASILANAVSDEKKNRVMEIVISSASPNQFITGKILAGGFLGLLMIAVWLGVMWMVVSFGGQPLNIPVDFELRTSLLIWVIIYSFLGYAMYGSLMAGLGALSPDIKDARSASMAILSPLILGYLLNILFIQSNPDEPLAVIVSLFPLTAPVTMIIRMTTTTVPLWQSILAALLMVITAFFIIRAVARLFRAQILLSGQAPTVKRFYRSLLGRS